MNLYVNGCSHTYGTTISLNGNLNLAYPHILSDYYNIDLVNDSVCGASNDEILRTTIEAVLKSSTPFDKVVIQFTHLDRFETTSIHKHNPRSMYRKPSFWNIKDTDPILTFYKKFFDRTSEMDKLLSHKLLNQMYMLECLFTEHAITDYRFIVWHPIDITYITYRHLNKSKIIFNANNLLNKEFKIHPEDQHFGPDAHQRIAEWIIEGHSSLNDINEYNPLEHVYT
jgi:hypothetical protein